jgi:hypothetical protein
MTPQETARAFRTAYYAFHGEFVTCDVIENDCVRVTYPYGATSNYAATLLADLAKRYARLNEEYV